MSAVRDVLKYHPSPYTVTDHAAEADAILSACAREFPKLLSYLQEPSNVLALGGMRGVSPYATFGRHDRMVNSPEFTAFLHRFGLRLIKEQVNYGEKPEVQTYMLVHTGAFEALPELYHSTQDWWAPKPKEYDYLNYLDWYMYNLTGCQGLLEAGKLPKQWLSEWWTPHDMCFGMLLGYPGTAICSLATAQSVEESLGVKPDMITVEFAYPDNDGTPVSYDIQQSDVGSKQILAHQKRWQSFFDMVYDAWPILR